MTDQPLRDDLLRHLYAQLPADAGLIQWTGTRPYRWVMSQEWLDTLWENLGDIWERTVPVYLLGFPVIVEPDGGVPQLEVTHPD